MTNQPAPTHIIDLTFSRLTFQKGQEIYFLVRHRDGGPYGVAGPGKIFDIDPCGYYFVAGRPSKEYWSECFATMEEAQKEMAKRNMNVGYDV